MDSALSNDFKDLKCSELQHAHGEDLEPEHLAREVSWIGRILFHHYKCINQKKIKEENGDSFSHCLCGLITARVVYSKWLIYVIIASMGCKILAYVWVLIDHECFSEFWVRGTHFAFSFQMNSLKNQQAGSSLLYAHHWSVVVLELALLQLSVGNEAQVLEYGKSMLTSFILF